MSKFREPCQLHNHSNFSLLDAVPSIKEWCWWCLENNTPGISITDHGTAVSLYDAIKFPSYIKEYNSKNNTSFAEDAVTAVPGVELYVKLNADDKSHYHICAWAVSNEGYYNLMKLASEAWNDVVKYHGMDKPRVTFELIQKYRKGLKFGTGCIASPMGKAIIQDNYELAEQRYKMYKDLFGDDLYTEFHVVDLTHDFDRKTGGFVPIQPDSCCADGNKQKAYNLFLKDMVNKYGGKCIAATDAHFLKPDDYTIQTCLLQKGNSNGWYFHQSYHQRTASEMFEMLQAHLGDWMTEDRFNEWIDNSYEVMNLAKNIKIEHSYTMPKIQIPDHIKAKTNDYNKQTYLYTLERIQHHGRWNNSPEYIARFKKEIDIIRDNKELNFLPYFLLYEDIGTFARDNGILQGIARGSAGGSLLSYYLKIIHIDPIAADLPFERFLSHARINAGSFPDIDSDFGKKGPIVKYLKDKYKLGFAQITTFDTMKVKSAIYDSMWSLYKRNRNDDEIRTLCKSIPDSPQGVAELDFLYGYTDKEGHCHTGEIETNKKLARFFQQYPDVEKMVKKLVGVTCKLGRHPSGFVVCGDDMAYTKCPTMKVLDKGLGEDILVAQFDGKRCEDIGLVKADILGVTTINIISDAIELIKQRTDFDYLEEDNTGTAFIYRLPEDKAVYRDFYNKKTDSSFQFNTALIKGYVQQFAPESRENLSEFTALCRPGAMDAPLFDTTATQYYLDVKNGIRDLDFVHPDLEKYVGNSYGVFVYQENVMHFLVDFCGYTLEESDRIRGAIAKKKHSVMMETFERIRQAANERGWTTEQAETICNQIMAFSRYSFNRSHSRAYGDTGYITMYLKHYHPLEWWTAVLNNTGDEDKMRYFMSLLSNLIRPPSLECPSDKFSIVHDKIVAPVSAIKKIGPTATIELERVGPVFTLEDYIEKIDHRRVNVGHFCSLVNARAVDHMMDLSLPYPQARQELFNRYTSLKKSKPIAKEVYECTSPLDLFLAERDTNKCFTKSLLSDESIVSILLDTWPALKKSDHPVIPLKIGSTPIIADISTATKLLNKGYSDQVGMILIFEGSTVRKGISKKTNKPYAMMKIQLSDGFRSIEATKWDAQAALRLRKGSILFIKGTLKEGWKSDIEININEIEPILEAK